MGGGSFSGEKEADRVSGTFQRLGRRSEKNTRGGAKRSPGSSGWNGCLNDPMWGQTGKQGLPMPDLPPHSKLLGEVLRRVAEGLKNVPSSLPGSLAGLIAELIQEKINRRKNKFNFRMYGSPKDMRVKDLYASLS